LHDANSIGRTQKSLFLRTELVLSLAATLRNFVLFHRKEADNLEGSTESFTFTRSPTVFHSVYHATISVLHRFDAVEKLYELLTKVSSAVQEMAVLRFPLLGLLAEKLTLFFMLAKSRSRLRTGDESRSVHLMRINQIRLRTTLSSRARLKRRLHIGTENTPVRFENRLQKRNILSKQHCPATSLLQRNDKL